MAKLKFHITKEKYQDLTLDALIAIEDFQAGGTNFRGLKDMLVAFVVDENNNPLPAAEARLLIGKLPVSQLSEVAATFSRKLMEFAVPKENGSK